MAQVFVDDFMHGLAGNPGRFERGAQQLWVARAALHAIHLVLPPPDVLDHHRGKDSVSLEKLKKGDACFKLAEVLLGFLLSGSPARAAPQRCPKTSAGNVLTDWRRPWDRNPGGSHSASSKEFTDKCSMHPLLSHVSEGQ